jgi:serine phosphatase RsbU (regulator of sigma subunit)/pSer/pThr/pTyr-binding forkhead associated (FHA) protein
MSSAGATGAPKGREGLPPAALLVQNPSGQRTRAAIDTLPFLIGRQSDNDLALRDNRVSRGHARIVGENGSYVIEDLNSRHGTWVNGERIARHPLRNSDRIEFGVRDSYQLTFVYEHDEIHRILDHITSTSGSRGLGANNLAKLRSLVEVARALQNSLSTQEVLTAVVDAALAVTGCERGCLLLRKEPELEVAVARDHGGKPLEAEDLRVPTSVIKRALNTRRELLSMSFDPLEQQGARPEMTVAQLELRSVVCLPLIHVRSGSSEETRITSTVDDTVGLLYLDSREAPADLSAGNRELLQTLAIEASTVLENARLLEEERGKIRLEDELKIARTIQQGLLPATLPSAGWFRAAGSSAPSTQVGGDYYDVRQISPDLWAAIVADVSGKGVSSALLASLLQGTFLMATGDSSHIEPSMSRLNAFLLERTRGEKYVTIFFCTLDSSGLLRFINAGHPAPFLLSTEGQMLKLHTTGMPVGMIEDAPFQLMQTQLSPGDKVVIYSDGLTEAESADGEFFDSERLRLCLRNNAARDAAGLHAALLDAVDRFTEGGVVRDDITSLVIEYVPE